jgi:DNA-binding MarR family transcriptional regulator
MTSQLTNSKTDSLDHDDQVVLSILEEIERNPETSQRILSNHLGISLGLMNSLVKRIVAKGYVTVKRINKRNVHYLLTPHGIYEKSCLTYRYIRHSLKYVSLYRQKAHDLLAPHAAQGARQVVIFGSGEEAELAYLAIRALGMKLLGIVDPAETGKSCLGHEIQGIPWLAEQKSLEIMLVLQSSILNNIFAEHQDTIRSHCNGKPIVQITI